MLHAIGVLVRLVQHARSTNLLLNVVSLSLPLLLHCHHTTVELAALDDAVHFCARLREGMHDVFYPDKSVLAKHLEYRTAPGTLGSYDYNPLQRNVWAIDYEDSDVVAPSREYQFQ
jgi:hypothetical protein